MRRFFFYTFVLVALFLSREPIVHSYEITIPDAPSTFGIEDLQGRLAYQQLLTADPQTGLVPDNIRQKELTFSRDIFEQTKRFRRQDLTIQSIGPANVGGRTRAIALDVRNENIILAGGVSGGMWKSTNGGVTWTRKSDPQNRNSVTCIVQDTRPGREDTWYHGTGELVGNSARGGNAPFRGNGIYKSTDNGETWNVIPSTVDSDPSVFNSQFQYIWDIEVNERNLTEDEVIVAAFGGILKSLNGGDTWTIELGQELFNLPPDGNLNDINASFFSSLEKTIDGVYYASLSTFSSPEGNSPDGGIYISPDADTWYNIDPFTSGSTYRRVVMGHAPSNPGICYALVDSNPTFILRYRLVRFNANGPVGAWSDPLEVPMFGGRLGDFDTQGSYNMVVKVDPTNANTVFVGGTNLYRSTDGFETSENIDWIGGYDPEGSTGVYLNHHPDQHELVFFPSDPNKMISSNDGGVRLTQNFNEDSVFWEQLNTGYLTSQFFTIALSQETDDIVLGGMQDNGTDLSSGSQDWNGILGGDGGYVETTRNKVLWFSSFQNGQTFRLTLNDEFNLTSFARVDPEGLVLDAGGSFLFINPFLIDPGNPNRMFIGGGNFLYVNDNVSQIPGGSQVPSDVGWFRIDDTQIFEGAISAMDISSDGSVVYVGSSRGELFKLTDANGTTDLSVTNITSSNLPEGYVSSISIDPEDPEHLLVIFSNYQVPSIFESTDGGQSFLDVSGNLEEDPDGSGAGPSVRWGEIVPLNSVTLYLVGTSTGLYSTETTGPNTQWLQESSELIGNAVIPMMDYRPLDGRLAIATHGNGVFSTTINDFKTITPSIPNSEFFSVQSNYPNPFKENTTIRFGIPQDGVVKIDIYSSKGEYINNILWAQQYAGTNSVTWNGKNTSGVPLANGIYIYRIEYAGQVKSGKLSLRK